MAKEYNETKMINFTDEATLKMFDKLCRVGGNRKIAPNGIFDNIPYPHRRSYDEFNLLIGDCYFVIPPEFIAVMSEAQSSKVVQIRQENTQRMRGGYHRRTILIDLVFYGNEQINGYKVDGPDGVYYVDGLRQLLAQFKSAPFLPVINELMNNVYNIWAVALQDITISNLNGFPDILTAQVTLLEVNLFPYLEVPNLFFIDMIDWDLFRFYYQRLLTDKYEYKKLQALPIDKNNNHFKLSILDANVFESKGISAANMLDIITDKKVLLDNQDTNYISWVNTDEMNVKIVDFQCKYSNILSCAQFADNGEPTMQYLGGLDTIYQITFETTDYNIVQAIEQCQVSNDLYTRQNQKLQSVGFVKLESELVEFCGGLFVMIENVSTNTVPGYANLYHISVQAVSYDIAQSEREDLNGFVPFDIKEDTDVTKQAIEQNFDGLFKKIDQDLYAERKIRSTVEMYPDLRLPTYKEVDEAIVKIKRFRETHKNAAGESLTPYPLNAYPKNPIVCVSQDGDLDIPEDKIFPSTAIQNDAGSYDLYVDPDFYVFYPYTYGDIESTQPGVFTDLHKNVINESKKVSSAGGTYEDIPVDNTVTSGEMYSGTTTPVIEKMIATGRSFIGCPYVWGAAGSKTPSGKLAFDCSGYISYIMQDAGLLSGRLTTAEMPGKTAIFEAIPLGEIKRGDLIHRYAGEKNNSTGHVAIFIGDNKTLEAQSSKTGVVESNYDSNRYVRGLRIKAAQTNPYSMKTQATSTSFVSTRITQTASSIIYSNEASYDNVNPNDNGSLSIGSGQWHGGRAKDLLLKIVTANPAESKTILGLNLFNKVNASGSWGSYIPSADESNAMRKLIGTSFGRTIQDQQIQEDVNVYIQKGKSYGLTDEKALIFFADGVHQYGTDSPKWATIAKTAVANGGSLDAIYNAYKTVLGSAYASRRTGTYNKLKGSNIIETANVIGNNITPQENVLTTAEFKSICKIVAAECKGQTYDSQIAVAQCLFDRVTNENKKWGALNQILINGDFNGSINDDYDLTETERAVKDVFCNNKKWTDSSVWYFISAISNPSIYMKYESSYDKIGAVGSHVFWGKKDLKSVEKSFTITDSDIPINSQPTNAIETKIEYDAQILEYNNEDVENFGLPYFLNTEKMLESNWSNDKIINQLNDEKNIVNTSFVNQYLYNRRGTLLKAFPTYLFCILDDQAQWYNGKKLWTNYYTHRAAVDIQIHESSETPQYSATISATNSYHNLDRVAGGLSKYDLSKDTDYDTFGIPIRRWLYKQTGVMLGFGPKLTKLLCELHSEIYDHALVREGARVHLRIGYGSDPFALDTVMNGHITDLTVGEQISMVVISDGKELLNNVVSAKKKANNNGWLGLFGLGESQEASNIIANQMCDRTNNLINYLWKGTFEASRNNIEHFGLFNHSTIFGPTGMNQRIEGTNTVVPQGEVIGWQQQYDILKNVYRANYEPGQYIYLKGILGADGEENIVFSTYNKTPWDVFQICTQTTPEYILKPAYHQFESRLFFGLPFWLEKYRYDRVNNKVIEECKTASQVHYIDSMTDIIDNQIRVSSRDSFTNARVMYQLGSSSVTTGTLYSDRTIDFSKQKTKIIDSAVAQDALGPDWVYERSFYSIGKKTAKRIGVSNLLISWEQQYKGSLVLLGSPGIHAQDTMLLNDTHVNMFGISKAREVFHSFNSNTGFTTTVVPGMVGFGTANDSGMILLYQNYLKLLTAFASYTYVKKQMNNTYQNCATMYSSIQGSLKNLEGIVSNGETASLVSGAINKGLTGLDIVSLNKWRKAVWTTYKGVKAGEAFMDISGIAKGIAGVKEAYSAVKTARNLKNIVNVVKAGSAAINAAPIIGQIIYIGVWLVVDGILSDIIEWFENKNVVTLLPMWYENYPFVAGVKDGENILVMKSNANATEENNDTSTDDQYPCEDY